MTPNWYGHEAELVLSFIHKGEPITKSNNTFFGRGHAFIPAKHVKYEKNLKEAAAVAVKQLRALKQTGLLMMEVWYYVGSKRRKDLPNLPKTTTDALNEICYDDDFQIHDMIIHRRLDREDPRIEISIWKVQDPEWEES